MPIVTRGSIGSVFARWSLPVMLFLAGVVGGLQPCASHADAGAVRVDDRAALQAALRAAGPGTHILLASGTYAGGLRASGLSGTQARPILIAAADPTSPPVIKGGTSGLHLSAPRYVELRDLVFEGASGNGLNIDDGGPSNQPAGHITLTRLTVRDVGPRGNRDGIKLSGVSKSTVRDCRIARWGSGGSAVDMVGCHEILLSGCRIGPARGEGGSGIQAKGGSRDVHISRCAFVSAGARAVNLGGSTGQAYFRPPGARYEARNLTVEDCTFSGGQCAIAFVGCDGATVRHNVIYRPRRWVLRILQETRDEAFVPCRNGVFERNVIVFRGEELHRVANVGPGTRAESFRFARNAWFRVDAPDETAARIRLPTKEVDGIYGEDPKLRAPERGDFSFEPVGSLRELGPRSPGD